MPQMSPLNWLILYLYLLMIMMIINILLNYLNTYYKLNKIEYKDIKNKNLYKWMW